MYMYTFVSRSINTLHYGTRLFILVKYQLLILILINTVCFPTDIFDISLIENFNI